MFTALVVGQAGAGASAAFAAQAAEGAVRLWLPAARSRAAAFGPSADLRGPLDLPVLIVAGPDASAQAARLIADLADSVIEAHGAAGDTGDSGADDDAAGPDNAGGPATALAGHMVALLNRGTPSGLVTPEGTLTMALMRSCSTWPCGVWIDGEKRTTPDGTSFAWQHWSHTFEYALAAGAGDWRTAGFAAAGQDYNHDLLTAVTSLHDGPLPASAALATVEPASALLSALKPAGNPLVPAAQPDPAAGVTVRLRDIGGTGARDARVGLHAGVTSARAAALCEDSLGEELQVADGTAVIRVPAAGVATAALTTAAAAVAKPAAAGFGTGRPADTRPPEPAQPVFARYWLHGKGPAPAGNMPVSVHLSPPQLALNDQRPPLLRLTVACGPDAAAGWIELTAPDGIALHPPGPLRYELPPLGHQAFDIAVHAPPGLAPGRGFVTARITDGCGQMIEDSVLLTAGQPQPPPAGTPLVEFAIQQQAADDAQTGELEITVTDRELTLRPGEAAAIEVRLASTCVSEIRGEAQLLSPFGSWQQARPWTTGFAVGPGSSTVAQFTVTAAPSARPGEQWWAIVKVMYFGRLRYTEPMRVTIG